MPNQTSTFRARMAAQSNEFHNAISSTNSIEKGVQKWATAVSRTRTGQQPALTHLAVRSNRS